MSVRIPAPIFEAMERFLVSVEVKDEEALGGDAPPLPQSDIVNARDDLLASFKSQRVRSALMVWIILGLFVGIVLLAGAYVVTHWNSPKVVQWILGGSGSLLAAVAVIQRFWRQVVLLDLLSVVIPSLPPEAAVKAIQQMYFREAKRRKPRRKVASTAKNGRTRVTSQSA